MYLLLTYNPFSKLEPLSPLPFSTITIRGRFFGIILLVSLSPAILFNDSLVFFVVSISCQKDAKDIFEMQTIVLIHALKANVHQHILSNCITAI